MADFQLSKLRLGPIRENSALLIHLDLKSSFQKKSIEFEIGSDAAMSLMGALQEFQAKFDWQPPKPLKPKGKISLRIVSSSDD